MSLYRLDLLVYSGRRNPTWQDDLADLPRLLRHLLPGGPADEVQGRLGYSGIRAGRLADGLPHLPREVWAWRHRVLVQGNACWLLDSDSAIERYLLASAPEQFAPVVFSIVTTFEKGLPCFGP